ncbi:hypothetical protein Tco_0396691 [Tanacetum coccineum]
MKRSFQGIHRPLLPAMLTIDAGQPQPSAAPTPSQPVPTPSPSHVQITPPPISQPPPTLTQPVQSTSPPPQPSSVQPTSSPPPIQPLQPASSPPITTIPDTQPTLPPSPQIPSPSYHDTEGPSFEPSYHMSPPPSHEPEIQTSRPSEESEQLRNLLDLVPRLESRVESLEKELSDTKQTLGTAILQLIEKVKKLEYKLRQKRKREETVDEEDAEGQDQDVPSPTDQGNKFATPEKSKDSGEAQAEQISPSTLEAAQILTNVASEGFKGSQAPHGSKIYRRKPKSTTTPTKVLVFEEPAETQVNTGSTPSAQVNTGEVNTAEQVNTAGEEVNTASEVNTGSIKVNTGIEQVSAVGKDKGQREGKAPMLSEETPKKSKEQILQEEASLAEAIRLDSLQKEEETKQIHLDALLAQRIAEEEELTEQQKKRKAQVQFEAQHYTTEDWDLIRAKIEANAELSKSMLGSDLQGEDFAKRMVDLVNQRKKYFAEERAKAKRNKPMTQSQLKTYMINYLKNQGTWKITQLKKLSFEEVKEEFDKLVKQIESFAPISFEATKASLKRFGEELQTKTPKRLKEEKDDEAKNDESTKKSGQRRKQMARKGMHTSVDDNDSDESDEVGEHEESNTGSETPINPVPVAMKTPSVATYKIIKQGEKGVYQIVREDGTDIVYINFGAMMKSISRDDLTELYRIVMNRYGMDGPEDKLEKGFWNCLRIMFEEPLSTDSIWSEIGQQKIVSWRYYDTCRVHCLNLESMEVYMLSERKYPLSAEVCQTMLKMKLLDGKMSEDCYRLLKMMEKQAGIRK